MMPKKMGTGECLDIVLTRLDDEDGRYKYAFHFDVVGEKYQWSGTRYDMLNRDDRAAWVTLQITEKQDE